MDPINKVKIRYNFRTSLKGNVTRNKSGNHGPASRGGTRNRRSIVNTLRKADR